MSSEEYYANLQVILRNILNNNNEERNKSVQILEEMRKDTPTLLIYLILVINSKIDLFRIGK
jgi:hypothetical protein